jgi:hypothetical protein
MCLVLLECIQAGVGEWQLMALLQAMGFTEDKEDDVRDKGARAGELTFRQNGTRPRTHGTSALSTLYKDPEHLVWRRVTASHDLVK